MGAFVGMWAGGGGSGGGRSEICAARRAAKRRNARLAAPSHRSVHVETPKKRRGKDVNAMHLAPNSLGPTAPRLPIQQGLDCHDLRESKACRAIVMGILMQPCKGFEFQEAPPCPSSERAPDWDKDAVQDLTSRPGQGPRLLEKE